MNIEKVYMNKREQISYDNIELPECCLMKIFSSSRTQSQNIQRNNSGLFNYNMEKRNSSSHVSQQYPSAFKNDTSQIKRSISAVNLKRRANRKTLHQTGSFKQTSRIQRYPSKAIHTSMDAQHIKKFMSLSPKNVSNFRINSQRAQSNFIQKSPVNFNQKHEIHYNMSPNQHFQQNNNQSKLTFSKKYHRRELQKTSTNYPQNQFKYSYFQNPEQSFDYKNQQIKSVKMESLRQSSNQQNERSQKVAKQQKPIKPFEFIESYIVDVKPVQKQNFNQQKQFDSIKTKGKAVQSFLFVSRDLRKTKKTKKRSFQQNQKKFRDLQNITVTSEYQQELQDSNKKQRIEQSAVMVNYFNPPTHVKDQMGLSRSKYGFN